MAHSVLIYSSKVPRKVSRKLGCFKIGHALRKALSHQREKVTDTVSLHSLHTRFLEFEGIFKGRKIEWQLWRCIRGLFEQPCQLPTIWGPTTCFLRNVKSTCSAGSPKVLLLSTPGALHSFHGLHLSSRRDAVMITVQMFPWTAQPKRKAFSFTFCRETKTQILGGPN